jgi:2-polyprenyl-3-methyl-5-hydroxy-6-metoxy-1,4-benzoquinol methylase
MCVTSLQPADHPTERDQVSNTASDETVEERARRSRGTSSNAILKMVQLSLNRRNIRGACLVDVGCGAGNLHDFVREEFQRYVGVDVVQYEDFPSTAEFCRLDMDTGSVPLPDGTADVVAAVEVIEHLENPRDFMRKLVRLAKPGGWVVVTTPNQLSFLSLLTLLVKQRFQAFQDVHYPAHLTALLEVDLRRVAAECGLDPVDIEFSMDGRIPLTTRHFSHTVTRRWPRAFSDNILLLGRKAP